MDQEADPGVLGGVHQGLGLVVHRRAVTGHEEQPVDALQCAGEGVRVIEVDLDRFLSLLPPLLDGGPAT
jgi:hypothetical protein